LLTLLPLPPLLPPPPPLPLLLLLMVHRTFGSRMVTGLAWHTGYGSSRISSHLSLLRSYANDLLLAHSVPFA
jgi:hypothetical protein